MIAAVNDIADRFMPAKLARHDFPVLGPVGGPGCDSKPPERSCTAKVTKGYRGALDHGAARPDHLALCLFREGSASRAPTR